MYFDVEAPLLENNRHPTTNGKGGMKEGGSASTQPLLHKNMLLPRRSLLIMTGEARYHWRHAILHRKTDKIDGKLVKRHRRVSLTFRRIKRGPCECIYPSYCDSQQGQRSVETYLTHKREKEVPLEEGAGHSLAPTKEEEEHVHKVRVTGLEYFSHVSFSVSLIQVYENIAAHFSHTRKAKWSKVVEFLQDRPPGTLVADVGM